MEAGMSEKLEHLDIASFKTINSLFLWGVSMRKSPRMMTPLEVHTEQMRKDVEYLMAQKDNEDERSEAWRFIDNRRRSVFKGD